MSINILIAGLPDPCHGNLYAMRGFDGELLWTIQLKTDILFMNCVDFDINTDGHTDCIISGRYGLLEAVDVKTGMCSCHRFYFDLIFGVLTPLSAIFQLYHGDSCHRNNCYIPRIYACIPTPSANRTSLILSLFIEVSVPSQVNERVCIGVSSLALFPRFLDRI